ncbi:hypothetical protein EIP91_004037 [Steccherinum ochraceum]|uniref:Uncharacterized protein n=1 Tax=Steccherinum ochraceum TaxID=92696 RepID=A0A4R0RC13_9APHY|nr:hypothetical protein EIP91_004037 [Steccherinum ochraceum]
MRFITTAALVALAATATAMSAPVDDDPQEPELYRRFADVVDAVYARGVHDGLHARSSDDQLQRRAPGMDGKPIEVYHPDLGRVPIQNTPGYQPMPPKPPGFKSPTPPPPGGTGSNQQSTPPTGAAAPTSQGQRDAAITRGRVRYQFRHMADTARRLGQGGGGGPPASGGGANPGGS